LLSLGLLLFYSIHQVRDAKRNGTIFITQNLFSLSNLGHTLVNDNKVDTGILAAGLRLVTLNLIAQKSYYEWNIYMSLN